MALANFTDLKASISSWLYGRDDLAAVIPDFITLSEARFNRELRTSNMVARATADVSDGFFAVPADWLETISLINTGSNPSVVVEPVSIQRLNELRTIPLTGSPRYYAMVDAALQIYPAPSAATSLELTYYQKVPALSTGTPTNWLLTKSPDLYLYGALLQAAPYLDEDGRIPVWASGVQQTIESMNLEAERASYQRGGIAATKRSFG